jgi:hypothetical protein
MKIEDSLLISNKPLYHQFLITLMFLEKEQLILKRLILFICLRGENIKYLKFHHKHLKLNKL